MYSIFKRFLPLNSNFIERLVLVKLGLGQL